MSFQHTIALAGLSGLLAVTAPAVAQIPVAQAPAAFDAGPVATALAAPAAAGTLATLPATADELTFSGETATRRFAVYVMPLETTLPAKLVLSYQSAVSVMPESSLMQAFVNDTPVGTTMLGAGGTRTLSLDIPPGMLQPGFNQVRIAVDQHHRVDCSIAGTYELWTALDPAASGLSFAGAAPGFSGIEDLPALSRLNRDGVTAIHARLPAGASAEDVARAMSAVQSAVLLGNFAHPRISLGPTAPEDALEVVVGTSATLPGADRAWLAGNTAFPAVTVEPAAGTAPARLVVYAASADELDRSLAAFARAAETHRPTGTGPGIAALAKTHAEALTSGETKTLAELGMANRPFAGRFYQDRAEFELPADFYPADYADAGLTLTAGYAAGLARDAQLIVRANGRVVSTLSLSSPRRGRIDKQTLRIPLGALQPGRNALTFEANLPNDSDAACDPAVQAKPPARLFISDASTLTMPRFARIGHVPDLSAMIAGSSGSGGSHDLSVLVKDLDPASLETAATFVARMAASASTNFATRFVTAMPHEETADLIGFGTFETLPPELLEAVRLAAPDTAFEPSQAPGLLVGAAKADEASDTVDEAFGETPAKPADGPAAGDAAPAGDAGFQRFLTAFATPEDISARVTGIGRTVAGTLFEAAGFRRNPMSDDVDPALFHRPASDASLVIAQGPAPMAKGAAWTVVAARDEDALRANVALLTSTNRWDEIGGAMSSLHGERADVLKATLGDEILYETQPRSLSNLRLVVAGWFSRHLESYVLALLLACLVLGTTTFMFLRSVGEKRR